MFFFLILVYYIHMFCSWLWGGDRNTSVPGIRMKYQPPLSTPSDAHSSQAAVASNGVSGTMVQDELPGIHNFVNEPPKTSAGGRNEPKVAALDSASSSSSSGIPPLGTTAVVNGDTGTGNPPSGGRAAVAAAINEGNTTERTRQQQQQRQHTNSSKRSNDYFGEFYFCHRTASFSTASFEVVRGSFLLLIPLFCPVLVAHKHSNATACCLSFRVRI
jgi:hypothetical protein